MKYAFLLFLVFLIFAIGVYFSQMREGLDSTTPKNPVPDLYYDIYNPILLKTIDDDSTLIDKTITALNT